MTEKLYYSGVGSLWQGTKAAVPEKLYQGEVEVNKKIKYVILKTEAFSTEIEKTLFDDILEGKEKLKVGNYVVANSQKEADNGVIFMLENSIKYNNERNETFKNYIKEMKSK